MNRCNILEEGYINGWEDAFNDCINPAMLAVDKYYAKGVTNGELAKKQMEQVIADSND